MMKVRVQFWSYFRELAGVSELELSMPPGARIKDLLTEVYRTCPRLAGTQRSTLVAVGLDYQSPDYVLQEGDEVSLFPPVQGG